MQVTKYPQRHGISARDLLRLAHPRAGDLAKRNRAEQVQDMSLVLKYTTHPSEEVSLPPSAGFKLRPGSA